MGYQEIENILGNYRVSMKTPGICVFLAKLGGNKTHHFLRKKVIQKWSESYPAGSILDYHVRVVIEIALKTQMALFYQP